MKRLEETFNRLKKENKKANSIFLVAGYPNYKTCLETMHLCADNRVDFLEIGMPFSDPSADGPTIKTAGTFALNHGATIKGTIQLIKDFRKENNTTPIVWMGYFNSIFNYGVEKFFFDIDEAGVDGLLVVDLPPEEFKRIDEAKKYKNIDIIRLITPTTNDDRIEKILQDASGFIYFVSIAGITGTKEAQEEKIKNTVQNIKTKTKLPVLVGFGIKNAQKAKQINTFADGTIIGSAVIQKIAKNLDDKNQMFKEVKAFLDEF